ncbi:MAG TPA: hypothetical protein VJY41_14905 [Prolixibacteraceae bacterium]|nr:hypothetical protein [Prolixibacteraceae bacterium]
MKTIIKINTLLALLIINIGSYAQNEKKLDKEVEVIKAYQPNISDAQKIISNPTISDTVNYSPTFDYRIYSKDIEVEKTINHLPVVKLGTPPREKSNTGYAKAGFGNGITPYAELVINNSPTRNTDFGMHLFHYSSNPNTLLNNAIKTKVPYSKNMAKIFAKNYFRKSVLQWDVAYQRERHNYYGFAGIDSVLYRQQEPISTTLNTKQAFSKAAAKMNLYSTQVRTNFNYNVGLDYNYFWNATGQSAHNANYTGLYTTKYRKYKLNFDTHFGFYQQSNINHYFDGLLTSRHFFDLGITPELVFNKTLYDFKAGVNLSALINADTTLLFNISPKIYFAFHPLNEVLTLFIGTDGKLQANNYAQAISMNPYMNYQTDMRPSEEMISFYGGFKGKISRNISYVVDVNYSINKNLPFYYLSQTNTASDTTVNNLFDIEYDNVNSIRFGGTLRYSSKPLTIELKGNYYVHQAKSLTTLSHTPDFEASLFTSYQITQKVRATLDSKIIGPRQAVYKVFEPTLTRDQISTLPTIIDINLGAEYQFSKKLVFFTNASNILNKKYEIWHGYNSPGLIVMLGASYTF